MEHGLEHRGGDGSATKESVFDSGVSSVSSNHSRYAWFIHIFTAMGAVVGMLAVEAVANGRSRAAMVYLLITQLIDAADGPMARQIDIQKAAPKIDGYVMDLVIDYVTCVIVPAAFIHKFHLLPSAVSLPIICLIVFLSAMWFSRTDMMTDDHWFNGFPATWNLIAPTMFLLSPGRQWANAAACLFLCEMLMTNVKFPHPVRSSGPRVATLAVTSAWLAILFWGTFDDTLRTSVRVILVLVIGYFTGLCTWRSRLEKIDTLIPPLTIS
jgi:phosphatidylcholine synthase